MKSKKNLFLFVLFSFILGAFLVYYLNYNSSDGYTTINVYNWGEYISNGTDGSMDVNAEFTKETGIKVNYTTFQSNEELFAKLSGGGAAYDVIIPSDYMISRLIENDMLEKLNFQNIPNYKFIKNSFKNRSYDENNEYSVPYTWGLMGIFINKNMVDENPEDITWDILWNEKYAGKILMFDNSRDAFAISLMRLKYSINTLDKQQWLKASEELKKQRPLVQTYVMDQIYDKMGNSEAALAPYYSGDAGIMVKNNPNIDFVIPKSGTNMFVDAMCIPKGSDHKKEAEEYINFMCRTDVALSNAMYTNYPTPHIEAHEKLPDKVKYNEIFYPSDSVIENTEVFVNLPKDICFVFGMLVDFQRNMPVILNIKMVDYSLYDIIYIPEDLGLLGACYKIFSKCKKKAFLPYLYHEEDVPRELSAKFSDFDDWCIYDMECLDYACMIRKSSADIPWDHSRDNFFGNRFSGCYITLVRDCSELLDGVFVDAYDDLTDEEKMQVNEQRNQWIEYIKSLPPRKKYR